MRFVPLLKSVQMEAGSEYKNSTKILCPVYKKLYQNISKKKKIIAIT
jgi:hypothetical protein